MSEVKSPAVTIEANASSPLSCGIVLYRSDLALLQRTLQHLLTAVERWPGSVSLTVVDQSMSSLYTDQARRLVSALMADSDIVWDYDTASQNRGYGAGHNRVLPRISHGWHLILNPDIELANDALAVAASAIEQDAKLVLLSPRGFNAEGDEEYLAKRHPNIWVLALRAFAPRWFKAGFQRQLDHYELRDLAPTPGVQEVPLVSGCCMLVKSDTLRAVGGFDPAFFMYFEDYDLTRRLAERGRVCRSSEMRVVHHGGGAARKGWRHRLWFIAGGYRFFSRWGWRFGEDQAEHSASVWVIAGAPRSLLGH